MVVEVTRIVEKQVPAPTAEPQVVEVTRVVQVEKEVEKEVVVTSTPAPLPDAHNHERELELRALTDPRLQDELGRRDVRLVSYQWLKEYVEGKVTT